MGHTRGGQNGESPKELFLHSFIVTSLESNTEWGIIAIAGLTCCSKSVSSQLGKDGSIPSHERGDRFDM